MERRLAELGYTVMVIYDRPFSSVFYHALAKFVPEIAEKMTERFYFKKFTKLSNLDYLVVVNGQTVSKKVLEYLYNRFPSCRRVLYMWDSARTDLLFSGSDRFFMMFLVLIQPHVLNMI